MENSDDDKIQDWVGFPITEAVIVSLSHIMAKDRIAKILIELADLRDAEEMKVAKLIEKRKESGNTVTNIKPKHTPPY